MDQFGFDQLAAWHAHRVLLPPGPLFCVIDGQTRGRRWSATGARAELRDLAEIINAVCSRRPPMISMTAGLDLQHPAAGCRFAVVCPAERQTRPERSCGDNPALS